MPEPPQKFYLTTPIYYVNARPHIGHAYTTIVADVLARRHRLLGHDTFFLTGTDEHGQKIERSAAAAGIPPQQFADQVSKSFEDLWHRMGITHNKFIRTTDPEHKRGVQKLWRELEARGFIELKSYTGTYCVSDETFVDLPVGTPCPDCGRPLEEVTEENYFFKLSQFQGQLIDLIESGKLAIEPETRRNEVLVFLRGNAANLDRQSKQTDNPELQATAITTIDQLLKTGLLKRTANGVLCDAHHLKDLSISRTSFKWGIPVPGNDKHVIYVWLDALANYMTAIGYGSDQQKEIDQFNHFWPADLHLVGKEIIRFHCVYWPAFLLAAGLPLPKKVQAHGWLLFEESKMSKSRGNIVRTETILDAFGPLCLPTPLRAEGPTHTSLGRSPREGHPQDERAESPAHPAASTLSPPTKAQQDLFAADVLRYFLLREIPFGQDGSFSFDALITRYNAELANGYGNLVSRTLSMIEKYCGGTVPNPRLASSVAARGPVESGENNDWFFYHPQSLAENGSVFLKQIQRAFGQNTAPPNINDLQSIPLSTDTVISAAQPWKKDLSIPDERAIVHDVLYFAAEAIRLYTAAIHPVLPAISAKVWQQLGLGDIEADAKAGKLKNLQWGGLKPGTKLGPLAPIFPRADKGLAQIMTDMEQQNAPAKPAAEATTPMAPAAPAPLLTTNNQQLTTETITIDDFAKLDLRAAKILIAERIPKADKLLRLEVDLGDSRRQILSGIAEWYAPEDLVGRMVVIIANLAPRKMRGLESHGMLLAASHTDAGKPILATFGEEIAPGARLK